MPRPVGEPGATGASAEAHRKGHAAPRNPSANTPRAAKTPAGAAHYAEQHTVSTTYPSGHVEYGPASPLHGQKHVRVFKRWPAIIAHLEGEREEAAKKFRQQALSHVYATHFALDSEGKPKIKTELVPKVKTSPAAIKIASQQFQARLAKLKVRGASKQEIELFSAIESRKLAKENYYINRHGGIEYNEVKVPKLKTSPEALQNDLHRVNVETREIKEGTKHWTPPPEPENIGDTGILGNLAEGAMAVVNTAANAPFKGLEESEQGGSQYATAGLGRAIINARNTAVHGVRTGLLTGTEYLTRPGAAIEQAIAHEIAVGNSPLSGLLSTKAKRNLAKKTATPWEVILHGSKTKHSVTGGDLAEAFFGPEFRQLGLPIDFATDPTMWIGGAGLPAKFAERATAIAARIEKVAPEALRSEDIAHALKVADSSGDYSHVVDALEQAAKDNKVSLRFLGKTKDDRAAIAKLSERRRKDLKAIAKELGEGRKAAADIRGHKVYVPAGERQKAVELYTKMAHGKATRPGFRLQFQTPLGRSLAGIDVPIPKRLANKRFLFKPVNFKESAALLKSSREAEVTSEVYRTLNNEIKRKTEQLTSLPPDAVAADRIALEKDLKELRDHVRSVAKEARLGLPSERRVSLNEIFAGKNDKRYAHEFYRVTRSMGHDVRREFQEHVARALKPVMHSADSRARVELYMHVAGDLGSVQKLEKLVPLSKKEAQAVEDMRKVYAEMERHGIDTGSLHQGIENYVPRYYNRTDNPTRPNAKDVGSYQNKYVGNATFTKHRSMPEVGSIADRASLALVLRKLGKDISPADAMKLADEIHNFGKIRMTMEDMAREAQRGNFLKEADMTELEKAAYGWSQRMKSNEKKVPALFRDLTTTDGQIKLHPEAFKYHNFVEDPFGSMSAAQERRVKLSSAHESLGRLRAARDMHPEGSKLWEDFNKRVERREAEVKTLQNAPSSTEPAKIKESLETTRVMTPEDHKVQELQQELERHQTRINNANSILDKRKYAEDYAYTARKLEEAMEHASSVDKSRTTRTERPPAVPSGTEAPTAEQIGLPSDAELADFIPNADEIYIGGLKDFRETHEDVFPILDPMLSNYYRSRAEGIQTLYRTRWQAMDKSLGRSTTEAQGGRYTAADGRSGPVSDLKPDWGEGDIPPDAPVGYKLGPETIPADEITFDGPALIPNTAKDRWYDAHTGEEYVSPTNMLTGNTAHLADPMMEAIGRDRIWPTRAVDNARAEFFRMGEDSQKSFYESGYEHLLGRTMTLFRYGVTTLFPAYHVRNMISDVLNSMLADPGMLFHPLANAKYAVHAMFRGPVKLGKVELLKDSVKIPSLGRIPSEDFLALMDTFGLRSPQHLAEFSEIAAQGSLREAENWWERLVLSAKRGFGIGPSGAIGKRALEFSSRREEIMRGVTLLQRMRRNGGDFADAASYMIKHHFDYADLTNAERRIARNVFLFYTWYRKNIPLQFMSLITRPGFFSGLTNTYIDLAHGETPLNYNWSKINPNLPDLSGPVPNSALIPDYMLTQLSAVTMNWNGHAVAIGFGAPWADMNIVTNLLENPDIGTRQILTLSNPAIPFLFEQATQSSLLTGQEYGDKENNGSADLIDTIAKAVGLGGLPKNDNGEPVLPWRMMVALNAVPVLGRASGYLRPTSSTEDPGRLSKIIGGGPGNALLGLNIYVSPKEGERLDAAYINRVIARSIQRKELSEHTSGESKPVQERLLHEFDVQTRSWAKEMGIPWKYLQVVPGIGPAYVTQEERESGFSLGGSSPLTGGSTKGELGIKPLGGSSSSSPLGLPSYEPPKKEYESESEEAIERLNNPGKFLETHKLSPLTQGFSINPGEANPLAEGAASAPQSSINAAIHRLSLNKLAREGKLEAKSQPAAPVKLPGRLKRLEHAGKLKPANKPYVADPSKATISTVPLHSKHAAKPVHPAKANGKLAEQLSGWGLDASKIAALVAASKKYGVAPELIAAIGKVESGNGTSTLPGVSSGQNEAGAAGPFQIGNGTGAAGDWWHEHMPPGANIYDYKDAAMAAAKYLSEAGATHDPNTWYNAALSYNHAGWYAQEVSELASGARSPLWGNASGKFHERFVKVAGKGHYVFPFPSNHWEWSRTDMGTDFAYTNEGAPIRALGSGEILEPIEGEKHWEGGNGLILKLDHHKGLPSRYIFLYEGINPTVKAGQRVKAGQVIATGGITGSIETGFSNSEGVPLAADIYSEGMETPEGKVMTNLLHAVEEGKKRVPVSLLQVGGALVPSSGGTAYSGSATGVPVPGATGQSGGSTKYDPKENVAVEKELENLRAKTEYSGKSDVSIGSGPFLSVNEAAALGPGSSGKAASIVTKAKKELETKHSKAPASRRYKFKGK